MTGPALATRDVLTGPAARIAPRLLGALLVSEVGGARVVVRLTEVEAYEGGADPASHAYRGETARTAVMFGPPGHLYCYFTYGMHWCANVVCGTDGAAAAVLLRAGEVLEGLVLARARRPRARRDLDLARGPARLASCLSLAQGQLGTDLCNPAAPVRLYGVATRRPPGVTIGPRVGISVATDRLWRFSLTDDPTVSVFRTGGRKRPRPAPAD